ncbi:cysteine proteinase [Cenococcum geophilum 1.58]|uniref:cysteine proteinase n=1 Tax=Cenococcum geophilum 1.58 TaxID=794803 RepID=UPI00358FDEB5|nr:cysteine proteinase [Cenococcum geophilum 1.58]
MSSFFGRFKPNTGPSSPASGNTPTKKDPHAPLPTPLEKLLADAGPIRADGSDKFFGFENVLSISYCNSIIQCLYYSVPFREQVINFPARSPQETLNILSTSLPRINTDLALDANGQSAAMSPLKARTSISSPNQPSPRKPVTTPGGTTNSPGTRPEDNKDSPEYKKKLALAAGPVLNMDYENSHSYGMAESLFTSLKDIFEAVIAHRSRIGVVSPNKFLEILRRENEMFRTAMHQDAHEFLNLLLNEVVENVEQFSKQLGSKSEGLNSRSDAGLNNALSSVVSATVAPNASATNTGWVHELFEGTLTSETRCLTCENTSQRDEAFLDLSVDLEQHSSVTSCLRKFSEEEMLCERNKFHCDKCGGLQEAEKRMKIKRLPRILALHLKRFKYTEDLQRLQKLFHRVVYPYYLRLFNTTDDAEDPDRLYELYAVVVHIGGGPYHGHYVSIIKTQDRGWLLFDDEMVEPVDKSYVRNFFGGENVLACAYVLFYQETTLEAMQKEQEAEGLAAAKRAFESEKEALGVVTKQNGNIHNGQHPLYQANAPVTEDIEQFVNLDHAATVPLLPHFPEHRPLENNITSPSLPTLNSKKSNLQSKKERAKEEKEKKAAEKELEKQAKQKRKEMETKRREDYKKQEDDLKAALALSKTTKAEEDKRMGNSGDENAGGKDRENGHGIMSGGLNRFRHSNMSLRHKPKFWPAKEKHEQELKDATNIQNPTVTPSIEADSNNTAPLNTSDKPEKGKNRFSLGRKKSSMLH